MLNDPSVPTFPSYNPQKCIDYIFALIDSCYTFRINHNIVEKESVASDHCPVWVEVVITEKK
jgi:endonuclease/exonuclease/phosphatase family metal-dependent hydrolase